MFAPAAVPVPPLAASQRAYETITTGMLTSNSRWGISFVCVCLKGGGNVHECVI